MRATSRIPLARQAARKDLEVERDLTMTLLQGEEDEEAQGEARGRRGVVLCATVCAPVRHGTTSGRVLHCGAARAPDWGTREIH